MAAGDADCLHAEGAAAFDVGGSVADDNYSPTRDIESELLARPPLRDCRKFGPVLVIRAECVDTKSIRVDPGRRQLDARAGLDVARQQAEHDIFARLERVEQLDDTFVR